jgi:predicted permease
MFERIKQFARRFGMLIGRERFDRDLEEEMRLHVELRARDSRESQSSAQRRFGNSLLLKEESRKMWGWNWLEDIFSDTRYAARVMRKNPGFTAIAVLTLALGIGANTAIFSLMNGVLLRPVQYPDSNSLVLLWQTEIKNPANINIISAPNFLDWQKRATSFTAMGAFEYRTFNISGGSEPEQVDGLRVSSTVFSVLGVQPMLGRTFLPEEDAQGRDHEVVLSYSLWQHRYSGNLQIVGQVVKINSAAYTVVGVMPLGFVFPRQIDALWVPIGFTPDDLSYRDGSSFLACARLKPGVTRERARAEMQSIAQRLAAEYPRENLGVSATAMAMDHYEVGDFAQPIMIVFLVVGLVLLIACANVANLLLARAASRQREMAIRQALGGSRFRIARQLLTESIFLAFLGGAAGLVIAYWAEKAPVKLWPQLTNFPFRGSIAPSLDLRVLGFSLLASLVTGILFGLAPAIGVKPRGLNESLKESGGRANTSTAGKRIREALVAVEVALALVVLASAALLVVSMSRVLSVNPGFNAKNVITMRLELPQADTYGVPVRAQFCADVEQRIGAVPGVLSVSADSHLPLLGLATRGYVIEGRPDPGENLPYGFYSLTCPNYFRTMQIPLIDGRDFDERDTLAAPLVAIINETAARRFWPNESPIGARIKNGDYQSTAPWTTIVGVSRDTRRWGLDGRIRPELFRPYTQRVWPGMTIVARTASDPATFVAAIKSAVSSIEPDQAVSEIATMEEVVNGSEGYRRLPMVLLAAFGILALILAAVGIYGVVGYSVTQRTHEIGIRVALGAGRGDVLRIVFAQSLKWVFVGIVVGLGASIGATRLLATLLYHISPTDPRVLSASAVLLISVALLATYIPARRAMNVDPVIALRNE